MPKPWWLDKEETPRKFSQRRERKLSKRMGARITPNSGARWHSKGDMSDGDNLIEVKSTKSDSMVVHKVWLEKIRQEAIKTNKNPIFIMDFVDIQLIGNVEKVVTFEEVKPVKGRSMIVHKSRLEEIRQEAKKTSQNPVFIVDFGDIRLIGNVERAGK